MQPRTRLLKLPQATVGAPPKLDLVRYETCLRRCHRRSRLFGRAPPFPLRAATVHDRAVRYRVRFGPPSSARSQWRSSIGRQPSCLAMKIAQDHPQRPATAKVRPASRPAQLCRRSNPAVRRHVAPSSHPRAGPRPSRRRPPCAPRGQAKARRRRPSGRFLEASARRIFAASTSPSADFSAEFNVARASISPRRRPMTAALKTRRFGSLSPLRPSRSRIPATACSASRNSSRRVGRSFVAVT